MIPHEPPFRFVGEVRGETPPALEVWADFPQDNPYTGSRPILLEAMAQAVGVFAGRQVGHARAGVLAMLKRVVFHGDVGDKRVFVRVTPGRMFGRLRVFQTEAHEDGGALLATAEMVVAET